ncbi:membrane protein [Luteitalea sp. TBR-22]|uniref:ABC transporter permease n=1 Tax=Luteitalea sp. TBR-22 TaxID=2802971 RepID=UPI001AF2A1E8|nr:ABC transporter permease [Luteitalea sp. TBR-22]BCS31157.1 membrane protein [Luteitalea sp. TBR-22]
MKYLHLVWRGLLRRKLRTLFTALSIFIAFLLFGALMALRVAFGMGVDLAGQDRLVMIQKVSFIQPLPLSYMNRIAATPGVSGVTHSSWFGGIYQDPKNFFAQFAVDPESWLAMYPEYVLPDAQKQAWFADRTGAVVGRALADRFGWKVGDRVPLRGTIWRTADDAPWTFTIDGIYEAGTKGTDTTQFFFHYAYFNETRTFGKDLTGWYVVRVADPRQSEDVAARLDALFANSSSETKTSTEKAFVQAFAKQIGDIGSILMAILAAVLFTILLVAANTMAQAVRERTNELAIMKTLGFGDGQLLGLVLMESVMLAVIGGGAGLLVAWLITQQGDPTGGLLPAFFLPTRDLVLGVGLIVALGIAAGLLPAWQAGRLRIVDALRRQG